jgi:hypothetical protein
VNVAERNPILIALKNLFKTLDKKTQPFDILNYVIVNSLNNNYITFLMLSASSEELTRSFGWRNPTLQDLPDFSREFRNYLNIIAKDVLLYLFLSF